MVKTIQADKADSLQEAYGAPRYIKELKSFRTDHKQALRGKAGKNDENFRYMNPLS